MDRVDERTWLEMPDCPGWWAFEGRWGYEGAEPFRYPVEVIIEGQSLYAIVDHDLEPVQSLVGKWYRLTMPWERTPLEIPEEVWETIAGALQFCLEEIRQRAKVYLYAEEAYPVLEIRIAQAKAWLEAQRTEEAGE